MENNFWQNNDQNINIEKAKQSFIKDFRFVKGLGYIQSHRSNNTGIGKTFEDVMRVEENNLQIADYQGCIELKAQRDYTQSMLTLFTKSPSYPINANTLLRDRYGRPDPDSGYNGLHTTIQHSNFNTFNGIRGFKLEINDSEKRLEIKIKNLRDNTHEPFIAYYSFSELKEKVKTKCSLIAYILADTRKIGTHEEFHFQKATLLSNLTFGKFLENIRNDIIKFDIRIGAYRSGKNKGKTHDHGSGFRVKRDDLSLLFDIEEIS